MEAVGGVVLVGEQVVRLQDDCVVLVDGSKVVLRARQTAGCISPQPAALVTEGGAVRQGARAAVLRAGGAARTWEGSTDPSTPSDWNIRRRENILLAPGAGVSATQHSGGGPARVRGAGRGARHPHTHTSRSRQRGARPCSRVRGPGTVGPALASAGQAPSSPCPDAGLTGFRCFQAGTPYMIP